MEQNEEYLKYKDRLRQVIDFSSNVRGAKGNIRGCDFDYVQHWDWGRYAVFGDFKKKGDALDKHLKTPIDVGGSKKAYIDTVKQWCQDPEKRAIYITIEHDTAPEEDIIITDCYVRELWSPSYHRVFSEDKKYSVDYIENIFGYMYDIKAIIESPSYKVEWGTILPEDLW